MGDCGLASELPDAFGAFSERDAMRVQIARVLANLCRGLPFESVTVSQICEKTGISRRTFYRYFKSKHDILYWYASLIYRTSIHQVGRLLTWRQATLICIKQELSVGLFKAVFEDRGGGSFLCDYGAEVNRRRMIETITALDMPMSGLLVKEAQLWSRTGAEYVRLWYQEDFDSLPVDKFVCLLDDCRPRALQSAMDYSARQQGADR